MSRVGKQILTIPPQTEVTVLNNVIRVKGPLGELERSFRPVDVSVEVKDGAVSVLPKRETKVARSLWGTYASHVQNMLEGVHKPFEKKLIVEGVGYRVEVQGTNVALSVGYSHPVVLPVPEGITVTVEKNEITVSGRDKELVGEFAATIRSKKKPEPYKGKGIRYSDEIIRRKQGKRATA